MGGNINTQIPGIFFKPIMGFPRKKSTRVDLLTIVSEKKYLGIAKENKDFYGKTCQALGKQ